MAADAKSRIERTIDFPLPEVTSASPGAQAECMQDTVVHDVRDVSPKKHMLCVSFRLPRALALATDAGTKHAAAEDPREAGERAADE